MGNRGKERQVNCEKCGRTVRKDKAVYIEKPILQNPLERHQLAEPSTYRAVLTREVAYCPGCGKHLRVYEKKIKQNIRNDERAARQREFGGPSRGGGYGGGSGYGGDGGFHHGPRREHPPRYGSTPSDSAAQGDSTQGAAQNDSATQSGEASSSSSVEAKAEESEESEVPAENEQNQQGGQ